MKYTATVVLLALLVAACGGATGATSTGSGSTTSTSGSLPSSSTSIPGPTTEGSTTTGESGATDGPSPTVPLVIAQVGFEFAQGDDPTVLVRVFVGRTPDGPWEPAGSGPGPTLTWPSYWVRFDITNTDGLAAVLTDLNISGFEAPLGDDVCELDGPLPQGAKTSCIVGEFPVQPGDNDVDFFVSGVGPRQGRRDHWYNPPVPTSLEWKGARNSFVLVFGTDDGLRLDGKADSPEIDLDGVGLSGTVRVDCKGGSPFDGTPGLEAYVIENFSAGGDRVGGCSEIPSRELDFSPGDDDEGNESDDVYFYVGAEATTSTTTTIPATTTVPP